MISRTLLPKTIQVALRDKAIAHTKERVNASSKSLSELSEAELECLVKEEEDKIISLVKTLSITALAALLGISWA